MNGKMQKSISIHPPMHKKSFGKKLEDTCCSIQEHYLEYYFFTFVWCFELFKKFPLLTLCSHDDRSILHGRRISVKSVEFHPHFSALFSNEDLQQ